MQRPWEISYIEYFEYTLFLDEKKKNPEPILHFLNSYTCK